MAKMAKDSIPTINIVNIEELIKDKLVLINVGISDEELALESNEPVVGEGSLFSEEKYNLAIVIPCLIISLMLVLSVGIYSYFQIKKRMTSYEPDAIS